MVAGEPHNETCQESHLSLLRGSFRRRSAQRSPSKILLGAGLSKGIENGKPALVDSQAGEHELPQWTRGGGAGARLANRAPGVPRPAKGQACFCVTRSLQRASA